MPMTHVAEISAENW